MFLKIVTLILFLTVFIEAKNLKVSFDPDYAPFSYVRDNKAYGLFIDIWNIWAKTNHHTIEFIKAKNWDDAIDLVKNKKVDFFLGTTPYEEWMQPSKPYYKTKTSFFTRKNFKEDIKSIGIIGDDYKDSLIQRFKNVSIKSYNSYEALVKALIDKKVDVIYDDVISLSYFSIKNSYSHLLKELNIFFEISDVCAISYDKNLIKLFDDGFKNIKLKDLQDIEKNSIIDYSQRYFTNLKSKRREISYVFDPDWKPFEYKDEMTDGHFGIIADILSIISSKTDIKFKPIATNSWAKSIELVKSNKAQMFSAVPITNERKQYLNFTKHNIYSYPAVLVSHKESEFLLSDSFKHKTIGIVKANSLGEWLKKRYKDATFVEFKNIKDGFKAIEDAKIDFFGINGVSALYYINVLGFNDIKIYSKINYMFNLKIAIRKDVPKETIEDIDKALSTISQREFRDIYHKWTSIKIKKEINYKILAYIFIFILVLIFVFIFINMKLKEIVKRKTLELRELNENLESKVEQRTKELSQINKKLQENIEYASFIQTTILPQDQDMKIAFKDSFVIWQPKDTVGGDIYFFNKISDEKYLLSIIDCTGHGVSGAFVTMLVKAIYEQMLVTLKDKYEPSEVLKYFNISLKKLLQNRDAKVNVGLDGAVLYIDKKENILKFSGANISLFYIKNEELKTLKADRYSVGYKKCDISYEYKSYTIHIETSMQFYISSDGFLDQNGGTKGFPFGKRRFKEMLLNNYKKDFNLQKDIYLKQLLEYENNEERNDDITFIGFKI